MPPGEGHDLRRELREGRFRSRALAVGRYDVAVSIPGIGISWVFDLALSPGVTELGPLHFDAGTIAGRVVDIAGAPAHSALVTLRCFWSQELGRTQVTGEDGTFAFADLPAGVYELDASKVGAERSAPVEVTLRADAREDVALALAAPARLTGHVLRGGAPESGLELGLTVPRDGRLLLEALTLTGKDGGFAFEGLTPGRYVLMIDVGPMSKNVELLPGADERVEIELDVDVLELLLVGPDGPLRGRLGLWSLVVDPASPQFGACAAGTVHDDGRVLIRHPHALCLLIVSGDGLGELATLFDATSAAGAATVLLSERVLELESRIDDAPPPALFLVGLEGFAVEGLHPLPIELARARVGERWIYRGIPDGALLELRGLEARGEPRVEALRAGSDLVLRASWP